MKAVLLKYNAPCIIAPVNSKKRAIHFQKSRRSDQKNIHCHIVVYKTKEVYQDYYDTQQQTTSIK